MANREQRGNREKKKPKAEKPKTGGRPHRFRAQSSGSAKIGAGKKGR